MRLLVVVPCFNRPDLLDRCLASINSQDDPSFDVIVADDASTDRDVAEFMEQFGIDNGIPGAWWSMHQSENVGATSNIVDAIRSVEMDPEDVVLLVDGDDALLPGAIAALRAIYEGSEVLLSYGSYIAEPPDPGCPEPFAVPEWVLRAGCIRLFCQYYMVPWNHPLSFRRRLFDALSDEDFQFDDGTWMRYSYDVTFMCPMVELAGTRVQFHPYPLYQYTSDRAESVARAFHDETATEGRHVIERPRKYDPLP